jgi:hypothetical protein
MDEIIDGMRVQVVGRRVLLNGRDVTRLVGDALNQGQGDGLAREVAIALGGRNAAMEALGLLDDAGGYIHPG